MKINERLIFTILMSYFFENTEGIIGGWEAARFRDGFYQTSFYDKFRLSCSSYFCKIHFKVIRTWPHFILVMLNIKGF